MISIVKLRVCANSYKVRGIFVYHVINALVDKPKEEANFEMIFLCGHRFLHLFVCYS